ncbi:MAG: ABC transporter ATP-binding protein/permease [Rhizobiaceae bacterium]|nr:ABC transporter ATP-binding protein/permease [Rhizobiaceae bacterium]
MRTFWGLMRAYWLSDRWKEAWGLTLSIILLTALSSKAAVWFAVASGELVNAIAFFHDADNANPLASLLTHAATLVALVIFKDAGLTGVRHLVSATLHRKWRGWLDERFNAALLDANHTHYHVQNGASLGVGGNAPDNIDQRIQESVKDMTGGAIGLAMGIIGVATALYFVGQKLIETSVEVRGLELLGDYGSAVLAFAAVAAYVPFNTFIALKMGRLLERLSVAMQRAEGSYRGELNTLLRRSLHVAAAHGEGVQKDMHRRLYVDIDSTWARLNRVNAGYMSFELIYNFIGARVVAYAPGLIPYMHNSISLKSYVTGAELVNSLISQCSWFIHVMPAIATLRANARRVTDLAEAIENVQRPVEFYALTGRSEFRYGTQHPVFGLTVRDLELTHQGATEPFLRAPSLRFRRGEWTFVRGESGCGKTSLVKALNGLWPHGGGSVVFPEGVKTFYAAQDVKLPPVSLKQLVCLPDAAEEHADLSVAAALHKAGLGDFIACLGEEARDGKSWDQVLSGGQKQKLVIARIVLQKPGLLFLDEASGALDPEAKVALHQAIEDNCPGITVISVMHEATPPKSASGAEFYHSVLTIADGMATKKQLLSLPVELTTILTQPKPVKEKRLRADPVRVDRK